MPKRRRGDWEKVTAIFKENALVARSNGRICEISPNLGPMIYHFKNSFAKKIGEKLAFLTQNKAKFITLVFEKNANFLQKIGKNRRKL
jgi:hypothetical protein